MTSCSPNRQILELTLSCGFHNWIARQQILMDEPSYERIRVLIAGELPGRAIQPKGFARRVRQIHISIYKCARWQMRHNSAHLKPDAEELCTHNRHGQRSRFGLRTSYR